LLFIGRIDGRLTAIDKRTGDQLWQFDTGTGAGIHGAPTIFEHDGVQYVAAFAGGSIYADGASGDSVWLFSLNGAIDEPQRASGAISEVADEMPRDLVTAANLERGRSIYVQVCNACHGETGFGGEGLGPALNNGMVPPEIFAIVSEGRNLMPSFRSALSAEQRRDVAHFVTDGLFESATPD